jgi:glycosyltransferase involved in cell wall biosynthesis
MYGGFAAWTPAASVSQLDVNILFSIVFFLPITLLGANLFSAPVKQSVRSLPPIPLAVSIVIPVFNRERYLRRAIHSSLNQSLKNIEVLVVDDASTDRSLSIVNEIMLLDSRLRLIQHPHNSGTHLARITAIENARGEFILSLDADDTLLPYIAEDCVTAALAHDVDMVEFQALSVVQGAVRLFSYELPPCIEGNGRALATLFARKELNWNLWKRLIRRSLYLKTVNLLPNRVRERRLIYAEDKLHFGLILLFLNKFYFLREVGYVYYIGNPDNSESGTLQSKKEAWRQLRFVEKELKRLYAQWGNLSYTKTMDTPDGLLE